MALTLASAIANAKNTLSDSGAWLITLEIRFADPNNTILRIVRNTEDIYWGGYTWTAFPFEIDAVRHSADGSPQTVALRVSNVLRQVEKYIIQADGALGSSVTLRVLYWEGGS
jgi:phage-related protein